MENWIKVSDRLPEPKIIDAIDFYDDVLAWDGIEVYIASVYYDNGIKFYNDGYPVKFTHWMPLPGLPKD